MVSKILWLAAGISDGLDMGANAKAALASLMKYVSRGFLGARKTFMGLSGAIMLSSYDDKSRNRKLAYRSVVGCHLRGQASKRDT